MKADVRGGASRPARVVRGLTASSVATFVAALSHAAAGGRFPSVALLALAFAFCALAGIALAGKHASWARLAASVAVCQGAFHLIFSAGGGGSVTLGSVGHAAHGGSMITSHDMVDAGATGMTAVAHSPSLMLIAHAAAGIVTVLALLFGERAFWVLFDSARVALAFLIVVPRVPVAPRPTASRRIAGSGFQPRHRTLFLSSQRHRGPPVVSCHA